MSRIRVLSELLVKRIAAGEVIERPANVVKELVENAIDAGAVNISVTIEDGGKQLVRVTDDGMGMTAEDLHLAVLPHATSKIVTEDDLFKISTMGFRGEALASIGAVSNLRIVSRHREALEGAEIVVSAEEVRTAQPAGCRPGTTVEVRDLFFNVPARRKFLRATATEVGHINEQFSRLALAHGGIGFDLVNNGRMTYKLAAGSTAAQRAAALFGSDLSAELVYIERADRGVHIEAFVAPPAQSRSTAAWQYFFLNGRYIRDRFIQHAVREAYRGLVEQNRYPVVFLFLTMDPGLVDVNVHPTKIEVRWQDSNLIHSQVLAALREKFLRSDFTPALRAAPSAPGGGRTPIDEAQADEWRRQAAEYLKGVPPASAANAGGAAPWDGRSGATVPVAPSRLSPEQISPQVWDALYGRANSPAPGMDSEVGAAPGGPPSLRSPAEAAMPWSRTGPPRRALQVHNTYLITETDEGLIIVDQHALHERIIYEQLRARLAGGTLEAQRLLLPETLAVTATQQAVLQENAELLRQLGIEAEPFGRDTVAIHAFPSVLKNADAVAFLRDLLDRLAARGAGTHTEEVIHELLDMMACKAAVKAGDPLSAEEIDALIAQKHLVDKSSNCPHGRPTTLRLTVSDLEKQFKRK